MVTPRSHRSPELATVLPARATGEAVRTFVGRTRLTGQDPAGAAPGPTAGRSGETSSSSRATPPWYRHLTSTNTTADSDLGTVRVRRGDLASASRRHPRQASLGTGRGHQRTPAAGTPECVSLA